MLWLQFWGFNVPVDMTFSVDQLSPNVPARLFPGHTYSANVSFKDAPVMLPLLGTTSSCVNLFTKQAQACRMHAMARPWIA